MTAGEVARVCRRCERFTQLRIDDLGWIVSPGRLAHIESADGRTRCGHPIRSAWWRWSNG